MKLVYYDDRKGKWRSHEIFICDDDDLCNDVGVYSHNPLEIVGYGSTKEEALEDFKKKFNYLMDEWKAFEKMLFETDIIENDIIEVD